MKLLFGHFHSFAHFHSFGHHHGHFHFGGHHRHHLDPFLNSPYCQNKLVSSLYYLIAFLLISYIVSFLKATRSPRITAEIVDTEKRFFGTKWIKCKINYNEHGGRQFFWIKDNKFNSKINDQVELFWDGQDLESAKIYLKKFYLFRILLLATPIVILLIMDFLHK